MINDDTVMPDGRPFFAWRNELNRLRAMEHDLRNWTKLKQICTIQWGEDFPNGDLCIRLKRDAFMKAPDITSAEGLHSCCEFTPERK